MLDEKAREESMSSFVRPVVKEAYDEVSHLVVAAPLLARGGVWAPEVPGLLATLYYSLRSR